MSKAFGVLCVLFCVFVNNEIETVTVPFTPCPRLFNYFEEATSHEIFGSIKFKNDFTGQYTLQINMSIATNTDKNIRITRRTAEDDIKKGRPIEYYVHFPYNHTFPKLTSATFNGKLYCKGPPETGDAVTDLSDTYTFNTTLLPRSFEPVVYTNINDAECGVNNDYKALIYSGLATRPGEYPWLVAIFTVEGTGSYNFICGGNLVSNLHVITAAHCTKDILGADVPKENFILVFGSQNITNWARDSTTRGVKEYHVHPDYKKPADADIAVLLLTERVIFNSVIRPVCIWDETDKLNLIEDVNGTVVGWGKDEGDTNYVEVPKQIVLPIVSQETCLRSDFRFLELTSVRTFCAGNKNQNRGPCSGDSGSGFIIYRRGIWKLRGIVSIALLDPNSRMCDVNNYIVFTDVARYIPWMQKAMGNTLV